MNGDSIRDTIDIYVQIAILAIVLGVLAGLMTIQQQIARSYQQEQDAVEVVKEYRKWMSYDNTAVSSQDVATFILKYRGSVEAQVDTDPDAANFVAGLVYNKATPSAEYTAEKVSGLLPVDKTYYASLVKNNNGEVVTVRFERRD